MDLLSDNVQSQVATDNPNSLAKRNQKLTLAQSVLSLPTSHAGESSTSSKRDRRFNEFEEDAEGRIVVSSKVGTMYSMSLVYHVMNFGMQFSCFVR